jgi:hypothetical protein
MMGEVVEHVVNTSTERLAEEAIEQVSTTATELGRAEVFNKHMALSVATTCANFFW